MLTIYDWFGYDLPIEQRYKMIRQAGFDGVLLWWGSSKGRNDYRGAPKLARDAGLTIENIHTPFDGINGLWVDNLNGDALTDCFLQYVKDCAEYEIPAMIVHLSDGSDPPPFNALGLERIRRIADMAEKHNINVALENLRKIEYLDFVLDRIDSNRIGFCYDRGHHNCHTPNTDLLSKYGSRLFALHLHDNDGTDDQHRLPFDGTVDWPYTMKKIKKTGYTGAVALEVMNWGYETLPAEDFLQLAFERAKKLEEYL